MIIQRKIEPMLEESTACTMPRMHMTGMVRYQDQIYVALGGRCAPSSVVPKTLVANRYSIKNSHLLAG